MIYYTRGKHYNYYTTHTIEQVLDVPKYRTRDHINFHVSEMFCGPLFFFLVLFLLAIVLSVCLQFTSSNYPFVIFKIFLVMIDIIIVGVSDCCLTACYIMAKLIFLWDDDDVYNYCTTPTCLVGFFSANSLKQQSTCGSTRTHYTNSESTSLYSYSFMPHFWWRSSKHQFYSL